MGNPIFDYLEDIGAMAVKMDGFDDAVMGYTEDGESFRLIYSHRGLVKVLEKDMSEEDALEYIDFNVIRGVAYMPNMNGLPAPIIMYEVDAPPKLLMDIFREMDEQDAEDD
ncbi:hypothetical protein CMI37_10715 [Candidatus Pacearchaeota archaeon]|nr:hypothetical protein [Candidatus Pacearchaeota archaeon]